MPQQIASPVAQAPAVVDTSAPEPLCPDAGDVARAAPPPPEEVKQVTQVTLEPDITTTSSIVPLTSGPLKGRAWGNTHRRLSAATGASHQRRLPQPAF